MADVEPLNALHYDLSKVGGLQPVAAPPYDVIDAAQRAELLGRSPYNVVEVDLPQNGGDPTGTRRGAPALEQRGDRRARREPALWALAQDYTGPDGQPRTRHGVFARVRSRTTARAGSARTSARTRARRRTGCGSRAPRARTSPPSSASTTTRPTPPGTPSSRSPSGAPWGEVTDDEGTVHKLWRIADAERDRRLKDALKDTELLIADGHHRYETARVYQQEEPSADHVLMCLVALQDSGPDRLPHAPAGDDLNADQARRWTTALERDWTTEARHAVDRLLRRRRPSGPSTSRTGRSPTRRWRASPSPTAGSTPRCSRR